MILEYKDIKPFVSQIASDLKQEIRKEVEDEIFISYPEGMQKHLCDGVISSATYKRVWKLWNKSGFPRKERDGIKGVYLSDLKEFLNPE